MIFKTPDIFANPAETCLDLVAYDQATVFSSDLG